MVVVFFATVWSTVNAPVQLFCTVWSICKFFVVFFALSVPYVKWLLWFFLHCLSITVNCLLLFFFALSCPYVKLFVGFFALSGARS